MKILFIGNTWSRDEFRKALNESNNHCFVQSQGEGTTSHWENIMGSFDWVVIDRQISGCSKDANQSFLLEKQRDDNSKNILSSNSENVFKDINKGIILGYSAQVKRQV